MYTEIGTDYKYRRKYLVAGWLAWGQGEYKESRRWDGHSEPCGNDKDGRINGWLGGRFLIFPFLFHKKRLKGIRRRLPAISKTPSSESRRCSLGAARKLANRTIFAECQTQTREYTSALRRLRRRVLPGRWRLRDMVRSGHRAASLRDGHCSRWPAAYCRRFTDERVQGRRVVVCADTWELLL